MVDWSKPLEAVHRNGTVQAVRLEEPDAQPYAPNEYVIVDELDGGFGYGPAVFNADGTAWIEDAGDWAAWTLRNVVSTTRENASFYMFKASGKWAYSGRGHLSEHVFKVFSNVDMRAQILNDNDEQMPGISGNGDSYNVVVIGDDSLPYGWPLHLNALQAVRNRE